MTSNTPQSEPSRRSPPWPVYLAFVVLALLAGPVNSTLATAFFFAVHAQLLAGEALCALLAGALLIACALIRRQKFLSAPEWLAILVLLIPQWCSISLSAGTQPMRWLETLSWGTALLLSIAAPLWLALLSALDFTGLRVPRVVPGAAIAGIAAVCLVTPTTAYSVTLRQTPTLLLQLLLNIAIVASWVFAAPRLARAGTAMLAGSYLLLSALGDGVLSLLLQPGPWQPIDWSSAWPPLATQIVLAAAIAWLWFWLLQRMALAAFAMRALAAWTAALLPGFLSFGFLAWRMDAALLIALAALILALRAPSAEEQPMALGLRGP